MPFPTYYNTGLASVNAGATTVTFTGAAMGTDDLPNLRAGDLFFAPTQPAIPGQRIESIDYDAGTAELWAGWPGLSMTDAAYEVRFVDDGVRSTAQTRRYLEQLGRVQNTGIEIDAFGPLADRATYDTEAAGFAFLSTDGDGDEIVTPVVYVKQSATAADWSAPVPMGATVVQLLDALGITHITVSTALPSGGVDGDLWFRVPA